MTDTKELTVEERLAEACEKIYFLEKELRTAKDAAEHRGGMLAIAALDDSGAGCLRAILRELLTLKWHKDTFGKTPEYLERMPKAWEAAKEAVV